MRRITDCAVATALKDLLSFYHDHGSTMYVAFLDASKAFDRVNYATLFCKLSARDVPGVILRLLIRWYAGQSCSILWAGVISSVFYRAMHFSAYARSWDRMSSVCM